FTQLAFTEVKARLADFGCLRKRANGGCGISRQREALRLLNRPFSIGTLTLAQNRGDACHRSLNRRTVDSAGLAPAENSLGVVGQLLDDSLATLVQGLGQNGK